MKDMEMPWYAGRLCSGMILIVVLVQPLKMPADPNLDIALPMIKIFELCATELISDYKKY